MADIPNDLTSLYGTFFGNAAAGMANAASAAAPAGSWASPAASGSSGLAEALAAREGEAKALLKAQVKANKQKLDYDYAALKAQTKDAAGRLKLDNWYKRKQIDLLNQSAALERDKFGLEKQKFQFQQDSFAQTQGMDLLKFQAGLSGPANFVQSANFAQGVAGDPRFAGFVNALASGQNSRMFGPASGQPQAQSLGGLAGMLGGGGGSTAGSTTADQLAAGVSGQNGGTGPGTNATNMGGTGYDLAARAAQAQSLVQGAQQLGAAGGGALGAQALESQSPTNMALLGSGFGGAGLDFNEYLQQYKNSRVGQGGSALAA